MKTKQIPHDETVACQDKHCCSCGVDEAAENPYVICGECGHVYKTAGSLRRAYRREVWGNLAGASFKVPWFGNDFANGRFESLWMIVSVRASKVYFCQECIHDF